MTARRLLAIPLVVALAIAGGFGRGVKAAAAHETPDVRDPAVSGRSASERARKAAHARTADVDPISLDVAPGRVELDAGPRPWTHVRTSWIARGLVEPARPRARSRAPPHG